MPDLTIIATTAAQGAAEAELDIVTAEFDLEAEAVGYARRMAEETHRMAHQLDLDFEYSHVSVFTGEVEPDTATAEHPAFVGMWFYTEDGAEWATAEALSQAADEAEAAGTEAH